MVHGKSVPFLPLVARSQMQPQAWWCALVCMVPSHGLTPWFQPTVPCMYGMDFTLGLSAHSRFSNEPVPMLAGRPVQLPRPHLPRVCALWRLCAALCAARWVPGKVRML